MYASQQSAQLNSCTVTYKCTASLFCTELYICTILNSSIELYSCAVLNSCTELFSCTVLYNCTIPFWTAILYCTFEQYCTAGMSQHTEQMYCSCLALTHSTAVQIFCTAQLYCYTITAQLFSYTVVQLYCCVQQYST